MWIDRRSHSACSMYALLALSLVCFWSAIALAANTGEASLTEHAVAVMDFQWWIIGGLFTLSSTFLAYIYITGQKATRKQLGLLFEKFDDLEKEKLSREDHKDIDHSRLCPVCRE